MSTFTHQPHPYIEQRKRLKPPKAADQLPHGSPVARFNARIAVGVTEGVGTMWCAYVFAALALVSLPDAIKSGRPAIVSWIAQTFLQLVLLSIIIVGQNIQSAAADKRSEATYKDADALLHEVGQLQKHLAAQDEELDALRLAVASLGEPTAQG